MVLDRELAAFKVAHKWDPNLPQETVDKVDEALHGDVEKKAAIENAVIEEDSPYAEVRAAVRNYDEDVPANTIRAWVIGLLWTTSGSSVNILFSFRNPSVALTPVVTLLLSYPFGVAWSYGKLPCRSASMRPDSRIHQQCHDGSSKPSE